MHNGLANQRLEPGSNSAVRLNGIGICAATRNLKLAGQGGVSLGGSTGGGSAENSMLPDSPVRNDRSSNPPPVGSPPGAAAGRSLVTSDGPSGAAWPVPVP